MDNFTSLRDRIAEAVWQRILYWRKDEGYIVDGITGEDVADAVIAALRLEPQVHYDPGCDYYRYVTDWIAPNA